MTSRFGWLALVLVTATWAPAAGAQDRPLRPPVAPDGIAPRAAGELVDAADARQVRALEALRSASSVPLVVSAGEGGRVAVQGQIAVAGENTAAQAQDFLSRYGEALWRLGPNSRFVPARSDEGVGMAAFAQRYRGLPVIGGQVSVLVAEGNVHGALGAVLPGDGLDVTPRLDADQAAAVATGREGQRLAPPSLAVSHVSDTAIGETPREPVAQLVWVVPVYRSSGPATVHVDAISGRIARDLPLSDHSPAAHEEYDAEWYDANETEDAVFCDGEDEDGAVEAGDEDGLFGSYPGLDEYALAWSHTRRAYSFYYDMFGRVSYDGDDASVIGFNESAGFARWDRHCEEMHWSPGYGSSDIPVHEFSHGVTQFEANLPAADYEGGALNESFSDVMAALSDNDGDAWLYGEDDLDGSEPRDMSDMPVDTWDEVYDSDGWAGSKAAAGVGNKVAHLLAVGGMHEETDYPVTAIGRKKTAKLTYAAYTFLREVSEYEDLRFKELVLAQAWATVGWHGFAPGDVCSVRNAWAAVDYTWALGDLDCDGGLNGGDLDADGDGVVGDNCHTLPNPAQTDSDGDGDGDACDPDDDNDEHSDEFDNCPTTPNSGQYDSDGDGTGNACEDDDGDGLTDSDDNCDDDYNPDQADTNGNGFGNVCDPDSDNDGVGVDSADNCPNVANTVQVDGDGDGYGDACDPCPDEGDATPAFTFWGDPFQPDTDGDGTTDDCDYSLTFAGRPAPEGIRLSSDSRPAALSIDAVRRIPVPLVICPPPCAEDREAERRLDLAMGELPVGVRAMVVDDRGQGWARSATQSDGSVRLRFTPRGDRQYFLTFLVGSSAPPAGTQVPVDLRSFVPAPAVPTPADVGVEIDTASDRVIAGEEITYTVTVSNQTFNAATGVAVRLAADEGISIRDGARSVGTLGAGESRTLQFSGEVDPDAGGTLIATATVTTATLDPTAENDSAKAATAAVDRLLFGGFRRPTENPPTVNGGSAGRTYPVKFQVADDAGRVVSDTAQVASVRAATVSCGTLTGEPAPAVDALATGSGLRFEDDQFVYTWRTPAQAGCYQLFVTLADGGSYGANFRLR